MKSLLARFDQLLGEFEHDPLHERVGRAVRVATRNGFIADLSAPADPHTLVRAALEGIDARTLHTLRAALHPDRVAIVDTFRTYTWADAEVSIVRFANALALRRGVGRKTPVVLMMENRAEYLLSWFGLFRLGARAVHVSYDSTPAELGWMLEHSGAKVIVGDSHARKAIRGLTAAARRDLDFIDVDGGGPVAGAHTIGFADLLAMAPAQRHRWHRTTDAGGENVVYTSGTTGRPKGAVRDFTKMGGAELIRILDRLPMHAGERHLIVSRLYHSGAQAFAMLASAVGATIYIRPKFDARDTLATLSKERINSIFLVPTMISRLCALPESTYHEFPTPDLRVLISGAAPFPQALRERAISIFGPGAIFDFYGATELGWVTLADGREMSERPGTVGRALPGQLVRVVDDAGVEVAPGEVGRLDVLSPQAMVGYLKTDGTAANDDAWLTVDDLARRDHDGYLYIVGRARDMIISGGVNLYPVEMEEILLTHADVADVAIVGVPDPEWGERPVAFVVSNARKFDSARIETFLREHVAGYKVPRTWFVVDELPRNPTGKILKRELRERAIELLAAAAATPKAPAVPNAPATPKAPATPAAAKPKRTRKPAAN